MKKSTKTLAGRVIFAGLGVLFQILWMIYALNVVKNRFPAVDYIIQLLSIIFILYIVSKNMNPGFKLLWTILILSFPVAGTVIYLVFGQSNMGHRMQEELDASFQGASEYLKEDELTRNTISELSDSASAQSLYIRNHSGFPVYQKTTARYFNLGQGMYEALIEQLKKAEHYIFMEYFIIDDGEMWQNIMNVLEEKARLGLDVRLIYDDFGCASTMPQEFEYQLQCRGIRCQVFNPVVPIASVFQNNRDHRKITVIDGHTGFTGGINLADEYINRKRRFGYWKDTGVMLHGEAVWSFTVMFLQLWSVLAGEKIEYSLYKPRDWHEEDFENDGFIQPYSDTPLDDENVGENVYLNIIGRATKYVYIFTPYLIPDHEMITALCLAAKSGVDVRMVTPGIPDKKLVYLMTRANYKPLLEAGVRVYEYQPGFLHAKMFVCDDEIATVGTINLDYRSLFMHFECGVWMYRSQAVGQLKQDAAEVLKECREIKSMKDIGNDSTWTRIWQSILRIFAPLL